MKRLSLFLLILSLLLSACDNSPIAQKENIRVDGVTASPEFFSFFDPAIHHELIIDVSKLNLDTLDLLMRRQYTKYGHYRISTYVKAKLTVRENGKDILVMDDVGLRTHGNVFSRYLIETDGTTMNTLHWRLSFDEPFELNENSKAYAIRKQRPCLGLRTWSSSGTVPRKVPRTPVILTSTKPMPTASTQKPGFPLPKLPWFM